MGKLRGIVLPAVESVPLAGAVLEEIGVEATKGETPLRSVKDPEAAKTDESATVTRTATESIKADETAPEAIRTGEIDPKADETDPNAAKGDESGSEPNKKKRKKGELTRVRVLNQFYGLEPGRRVHPDVKKAGIRLGVDYPYAKVANLLGGVSTMTIWRAINKYAPPEMPLPDEKRRVLFSKSAWTRSIFIPMRAAGSCPLEPSPKAA